MESLSRIQVGSYILPSDHPEVKFFFGIRNHEIGGIAAQILKTHFTSSLVCRSLENPSNPRIGLHPSDFDFPSYIRRTPESSVFFRNLESQFFSDVWTSRKFFFGNWNLSFVRNLESQSFFGTWNLSFFRNLESQFLFGIRNLGIGGITAQISIPVFRPSFVGRRSDALKNYFGFLIFLANILPIQGGPTQFDRSYLHRTPIDTHFERNWYNIDS